MLQKQKYKIVIKMIGAYLSETISTAIIQTLRFLSSLGKQLSLPLVGSIIKCVIFSWACMNIGRLALKVIGLSKLSKYFKPSITFIICTGLFLWSGVSQEWNAALQWICWVSTLYVGFCGFEACLRFSATRTEEEKMRFVPLGLMCWIIEISVMLFMNKILGILPGNMILIIAILQTGGVLLFVLIHHSYLLFWLCVLIITNTIPLIRYFISSLQGQVISIPIEVLPFLVVCYSSFKKGEYQAWEKILYQTAALFFIYFLAHDPSIRFQYAFFMVVLAGSFWDWVKRIRR